MLTGAAPRKEHISTLTNEGVDLFVCLMTKRELRENQVDYHKFVNDSQVLLFEMEDGRQVEDARMKEIIAELTELYKDGKNLYIHCKDGHGRSAHVSTLVYGALKNLPARDAYNHVSRCYSHRAKRIVETGMLIDHKQKAQMLKMLN